MHARWYTARATPGRSHERTTRMPGMVTDGLGDFRAAGSRIHHSGRQVTSLEQFEDALLRQRHLLGRLEHERVAARDRERQEPQRHHRRKIERRDTGADADGLAHDLTVQAGCHVLEPVAHQQGRRAARHLDAFDPAAHAAARFIQRLAMLGRDDASDLVDVILEQLPEPEERARTGDRWRLTPARKRGDRRLHRRVEIGTG